MTTERKADTSKYGVPPRGPLTAQWVFDMSVQHIRKQGRPSHLPDFPEDGPNSDGEGRYRGPDGMACAVGCLISDRRYRKSIEGKVAQQIHEVLGVRLAKHRNLLNLLQRAHDGTLVKEGFVKWEQSLQRIASSQRLTYTPPEAPCQTS